VRRAALKAILVAPSLRDAPELLQVARLDPDDTSRRLAITAVGEIGDAGTLLALRDLWDTMNEPARLSCLQALDAPASRKAGGTQILLRLMETENSLAGVVAASLLIRRESPLQQAATARLLRALHEGTLSERLVALRTLPMQDLEVQGAVREMGLQGAPYLRTAALERWIEHEYQQLAAVQKLQSIAESGEADALEATKFLARRGDIVSVSRLDREINATLASDRLAAARVMLQIGRWNTLAQVLADDHPAVRLSIACAVLAKRL
jgi:hypothetical protein